MVKGIRVVKRYDGLVRGFVLRMMGQGTKIRKKSGAWVTDRGGTDFRSEMLGRGRQVSSFGRLAFVSTVRCVLVKIYHSGAWGANRLAGMGHGF
jgi:hypothetical protein